MNKTTTSVMMTLLLLAGCGLDDTAEKNGCTTQAECLDGYVCSASGTCEEDPGEPMCTPRTCDANQCEVIDDGCGGTVDCGACDGTDVCGVETPNVCGPEPETCTGESEALLCQYEGLEECGTAQVTDACGDDRALNCGTCSGAAECGAWSHGLCDEIVCTSAGWCRVLGGTHAGTYHVRDLTGDAQGNIWAVSSTSSAGGRLIKHDGTRWTFAAVGPHELRAVAKGGAGKVWAVSAGGAIVSLEGASLATADTTPYTWNAVHATSAADVWVAGTWGSGSGASARLKHFDGSTWDLISLGGAFDLGWHLLGVTAAGPDRVWAVGAAVGNGSVTDTAGPLIASWNGAAWTIDRTLPTSQYLRAVWAASPTNVWAVGDAGAILHFDGNDWTASPSGVTQQLLAVTGIGNTVWAAGTNGMLLRKDGAGPWTQQATGTTRAIRALWARAANDVWAGGDDGLLLHDAP